MTERQKKELSRTCGKNGVGPMPAMYQEDAGILQKIAAMEVVTREAQRRGKGKSGKMSCPVPGCDGTVSYATAQHNGHVRAACTRAGCLNWVE